MSINIALKNVEVNFCNGPAPYIIDISYFNGNAYNDIQANGHYLTDLNLIHCASIHYQSRFQTNIARRLKYTLDTIEPSLLDNRTNFYFDDFEDSELQKNTSEVIGVGFTISLFQRLLDVNFNCFNSIPISGRRKRCDYEVNKNGNIFILESKGRKTNLNAAINMIFNQKAAGGIVQAKYGCISVIKRNGDPVTITVVDPPHKDIPKSKEDRILDLLIYYTKSIQLSGFYNLARLLNERIDQIIVNRQMIEEYNNNHIEYSNVIKAGLENIITVSKNLRFKTFMTKNMNAGLKRIINCNNKEYILLFGMDPYLIDIIEKQDFDSLLKYNYEGSSDINNNIPCSVHNDGTFLSILPKQLLK